jgi:hypothetical protein
LEIGTYHYFFWGSISSKMVPNKTKNKDSPMETVENKDILDFISIFVTFY